MKATAESTRALDEISVKQAHPESNGPGRNAEMSCVSMTSTNSSESVSPKTSLKAALCCCNSASGR